MSTPRKPLWLDGLFLEPNHLQQQDRYHERLLAARAASLRPHAWGILDCAIDSQRLQSGELSVARLRAVLPDGTLLDVGEGMDDSLPARAIEGLRAANAAVDVYVALAQEAPAAANVDLVGDPTSHARFIKQETEVADFNSGREERAVPWGRLNLELVMGEERRDRFDAIRIAQVVRSTSGALALKDTFVPPSLQIGASAFLMSGFQRVLGAMTAKQQALSSSRRQRSATVIEFQAADAARFWLLHTLNQKLPTIAEVAQKPSTHPDEAYRELAELLGMLCTFDTDANPLTIPRYDHLDAGATFAPMFTMAISLLDRLIAERFVEIPLERHEGGYHIGQLRDPSLFRHAFFLAVSGTYTLAQLREHIPRLTKIASARQIGAIVNSAVNGARLAFEQYPPGALPVKPDVVFFRVETVGDFWNDMVATGSVAIYEPMDPNAVRLALYAVDPDTLQ
jgi:type VI secretion system protein ImpJ